MRGGFGLTVMVRFGLIATELKGMGFLLEVLSVVPSLEVTVQR